MVEQAEAWRAFAADGDKPALLQAHVVRHVLHPSGWAPLQIDLHLSKPAVRVEAGVEAVRHGYRRAVHVGASGRLIAERHVIRDRVTLIHSRPVPENPDVPHVRAVAAPVFFNVVKRIRHHILAATILLAWLARSACGFSAFHQGSLCHLALGEPCVDVFDLGFYQLCGFAF